MTTPYDTNFPPFGFPPFWAAAPAAHVFFQIISETSDHSSNSLPATESIVACLTKSGCLAPVITPCSFNFLTLKSPPKNTFVLKTFL